MRAHHGRNRHRASGRPPLSAEGQNILRSACSVEFAHSHEGRQPLERLERAGGCAIVNFAFIQGKIDYGKGIAATKLGPPYDCYRITPTSNGDFPAGWTKTQAGYPIFAKKFTNEGKILTGMRTSTQWLDLIANMNPFLLGDVFLLVDPPFSPGASYGPGATS